jgi:zinc protease
LADQVLGGSFGSRLVQDVREKRGYAYYVHSDIRQRLAAAVFRIRAETRNEAAGEALGAILENVERMRDKPVSPEEFDQAKNYLAGEFARDLETQEGLAAALLHIELQRLPADYLDSFVAKVQAVSAPAALRAANAFMRPGEMTVVAVGDAAKLRPALARFSAEPVATVDQNGD